MNRYILRQVAAFILVAFTCTTIAPRGYAADMILPQPGTMLAPSPAFTPVILKGLQVRPENPMMFDFIMDTGDTGLKAGKDDAAIRAESQKLIKYFMASLTLQEKDQWVNLSPYEKDRIMPAALEKTEMGRDMLAQDYILKQMTASLVYPEKDLGKQFWAKVYAQAQARFGDVAIPMDTFNKVWITADKADVYVHDNAAYVVGSHLKVMLENDYIAARRGGSLTLPVSNEAGTGGSETRPCAQELAQQAVRDIVLPELEKEVNTGKNFANLRQIFHAMILAAWYKQNLKQALLNQVYADKSKVNGVGYGAGADLVSARNGGYARPVDPQQIYARYVEAYKKGVFNFIKEDVTATGETVPRKYFSGGVSPAMGADLAMRSVGATDPGVRNFAMKNALRVSAGFNAAMKGVSGRVFEDGVPGFASNGSTRYVSFAEVMVYLQTREPRLYFNGGSQEGIRPYFTLFYKGRSVAPHPFSTGMELARAFASFVEEHDLNRPLQQFTVQRKGDLFYINGPWVSQPHLAANTVKKHSGISTDAAWGARTVEDKISRLEERYEGRYRIVWDVLARANEENARPIDYLRAARELRFAVKDLDHSGNEPGLAADRGLAEEVVMLYHAASRAFAKTLNLSAPIHGEITREIGQFDREFVEGARRRAVPAGNEVMTTEQGQEPFNAAMKNDLGTPGSLQPRGWISTIPFAWGFVNLNLWERPAVGPDGRRTGDRYISMESNQVRTFIKIESTSISDIRKMLLKETAVLTAGNIDELVQIVARKTKGLVVDIKMAANTKIAKPDAPQARTKKWREVRWHYENLRKRVGVVVVALDEAVKSPLRAETQLGLARQWLGRMRRAYVARMTQEAQDAFGRFNAYIDSLTAEQIKDPNVQASIKGLGNDVMKTLNAAMAAEEGPGRLAKIKARFVRSILIAIGSIAFMSTLSTSSKAEIEQMVHKRYESGLLSKIRFNALNGEVLFDPRYVPPLIRKHSFTLFRTLFDAAKRKLQAHFMVTDARSAGDPGLLKKAARELWVNNHRFSLLMAFTNNQWQLTVVDQEEYLRTHSMDEWDAAMMVDPGVLAPAYLALTHAAQGLPYSLGDVAGTAVEAAAFAAYLFGLWRIIEDDVAVPETGKKSSTAGSPAMGARPDAAMIGDKEFVRDNFVTGFSFVRKLSPTESDEQTARYFALSGNELKKQRHLFALDSFNVVLRMTAFENDANGSYVYDIFATPSEYPDQEIYRGHVKLNFQDGQLAGWEALDISEKRQTGLPWLAGFVSDKLTELKGRSFVRDAAMKMPGGIDLNAQKMRMNTQGQQIDMTWDPAMVAQFQRGDFSGLTPVIYSITAIENPTTLLN